MREDAKGTTLVEDELTVSTETLRAVGTAIGTPSAGDTAMLVPYFGAVLGGEGTVVDGLGLDLARALLAGIGYEWHRPFVPDERVRVRVVVEDVYTKGANQFGIVVAEFADVDGAVVQRQSITFIERGATR